MLAVQFQIIVLLRKGFADVDKEFDAHAVEESLYQLKQREDARSIFG